MLTRNVGKMKFLRHLGKSIRLRAYPPTVRHVKRGWESMVFLFRGFCLEKISMNAILGHFQVLKLCISYFKTVKM